jgi:hypothetical protein
LAALAWTLVLTAGCPAELPQDEMTTPSVVAGVYWVQPVDGELMYFEPASQRGETGQWRDISPMEDAAWYSEPGPHRYDPAEGWSFAPDTPVQVLDDIIQTHDAPPPVPPRK